MSQAPLLVPLISQAISHNISHNIRLQDGQQKLATKHRPECDALCLNASTNRNTMMHIIQTSNAAQDQPMTNGRVSHLPIGMTVFSMG